MKSKKPTPLQVYDCYKIFNYLKDSRGFTDEDIENFKFWIRDTYESLIYPCNCILTLNLEGEIDDPIIKEILTCLIEDFPGDGDEVLINYWY